MIKTTEEKYLDIFQKGFNYSQDGPGNRLVYHLAGCNLFCPWCSNPEGMKKESFDKKSITELVSEALSCKMMFIDGGGVTLTGGEVSCQKNSAHELIIKLKESGINTCIETNASLPGCEELFSDTDFMIADFKSADGEKLKAFTGADITTVKQNLLFRAKLKKPLLIRVPLIGGFNNTPADADGFSEFFSELKAVEGADVRFEILTYHEFGKEKWQKLGREYKVTNGFVTGSDVNALKTALSRKNITTITT